MNSVKKYIAEFIGTAILVLFGCGTAVVSGGNLILTSFAFGLAIVAGAYAIGDISGCHVNPAVSLAMLISGKLSIKDFFGYVASQIAGAFAGSGLLYAILSCTNLGTKALGANGFDGYSATGLNMTGAILVEIILTFVFVYTILGVTAKVERAHIAGIVIALTLTFVHIIGINLTGTSVNPARSLAPAVLLGGEAIKQVWVFIVAPFAGAAVAACVYKMLNVGCAAETKPTKKSKK
ncbi:aquaporin [Candidatus Saccharibacteria bacterium]|nr:aquaporin [Candidatus Saccharibacteria bacterium]